jgi:hypothetical protein
MWRRLTCSWWSRLARGMAAFRDPQGFARLLELREHGPGGPVPATARTYTLRRAAVIVAAKGGMLDGIQAGDVLELPGTEADVLGAARGEAAACYRLLRQLGTFGPAAPARLRELRTAGQRTPEEMIDRHHLACRPIRDQLVDYLRERQPGMDYGSLEQLARKLGMFWADLEAHHPGIDSLHLNAEVADAWKQRMRTKPKTITAADGTKTVIETERICHREFLTPIRAFYLDLAQWAVEDPARWARWAAPCPVGPAETIQGRSSGTASRGWTPGPANGSRSCQSWSAAPPGSTPTRPRSCKRPAPPGLASSSPPAPRSWRAPPAAHRPASGPKTWPAGNAAT